MLCAHVHIYDHACTPDIYHYPIHILRFSSTEPCVCRLTYITYLKYKLLVNIVYHDTFMYMYVLCCVHYVKYITYAYTQVHVT